MIKFVKLLKILNNLLKRMSTKRFRGVLPFKSCRVVKLQSLRKKLRLEDFLWMKRLLDPNSQLRFWIDQGVLTFEKKANLVMESKLRINTLIQMLSLRWMRVAALTMSAA